LWRGACATAPPGHRLLRVAAMAQPAATAATTATTTTIRFLITAPRGRCIGPPGLPLCLPVTRSSRGFLYARITF
jgi:hypothetical protein